ncbi:MAG: hypothetical protein ACQXXG_09870 [Candidatus Bathyarchaeia archaeon]|nr:hypothetical protein [Candidatus Bathyarchaeota archaeon A05DMB-3]
MGIAKSSRRTVIEVREDLHREIRKLALLNDLRIYVLANAMMEDYLKDEERVKALIKRLKLQAGSPIH